MHNLSGLSSLRKLTVGGLARSQIWQRTWSKTTNSQCGIGQKHSPGPNLESTYRSVRCRLMRNQSVAVTRHRSNPNFLKTKPIPTAHAASAASAASAAGCHARLPVAMRYYARSPVQKRLCPDYGPFSPLTSTCWANFQGQRTYATMGNRIERNKFSKRLKASLVERPLVPILSYVKTTSNTRRTASTTSTASTARAANAYSDRSDKKGGDRLCNMHVLGEQRAATVGGRRKEEKLATPGLPAMRILDRKEKLAKGQSIRSASLTRQPSSSLRFEPQSLPRHSLDATKQASSVHFLMSKHPLLKKIASPDIPLLRATNKATRFLETYETRLRAKRQAQPLKLRMPPQIEDDLLRVRKTCMPSNPHLLPGKYGSKVSRLRTPTFTMPSINAYKVPQRPKNEHKKKPRQPMITSKSQKPKPSELEVKMAKRARKHADVMMRPEREDLNSLLGDLLDKKPAKQQQVETIEFNKVSPLFKLVTTSLEGRSKLHTRTFEKQLEAPQLYRHPTIRNFGQPMIANRRTVMLGQSAAIRAKNELDNKLCLLLRAGQDPDQYDDEDDG